MKSDELRQKLFDEYEESLFRLAVFDAAEREGDLETDIVGEPEEQPTDQQIARFIKAVKRSHSKSGRKKKTLLRVFNKAAAAVAVLLVIFFVSMVTVDAFRLEVLNFLTWLSPEYTSLSYVPDEAAADMDGNTPRYVPEGYSLNETSETDNYSKIVYTVSGNGDKIIILYEYTQAEYVTIDTESVDDIKNTQINGEEATLTFKDSMTGIYWSTGDHFYYIYGSVGVDELIKMAESVGE